MHILILGGTAFAGRAMANEAVSRGHRVTLFNRGTKPSPKGTTTIIGDRLSADSLELLADMTFDAVVDTWSAEAEPAMRALETLRGRIGHYTYISTLSVCDYASVETGDKLNDESIKLYDLEAPDAKKSAYQFNKLGFEVAAARILDDTPFLIARPGVILGPYEGPHIERGRLLWWLDRLHRGGPMLAPGPEDMGIQVVDVRDLARFVVDGAEKHTKGAYNIISDVGKVTMGDVLKTGCQVTGDKAELVWKPPKDITDTDIIPFMELPMWVDPNSDKYASLYRWDISKAKAAGLTCRPIAQTIRDTWKWMQGPDGPVPAPEGSDSKRGGLSWEKERKVLGL
ncbi:hypothetical protein K4F52_009669 [Lecanicillium sp. MT-2017a]|nr:hypothetical protein K4F52_009669 [Lecanicillium sp. MT-2017a]